MFFLVIRADVSSFKLARSASHHLCGNEAAREGGQATKVGICIIHGKRKPPCRNLHERSISSVSSLVEADFFYFLFKPPTHFLPFVLLF